jgi:hypothetical protein
MSRDRHGKEGPCLDGEWTWFSGLSTLTSLDSERSHPMATGLILVDIQNEYFPGGRMELAGIQRASANAREVLTPARP